MQKILRKNKGNLGYFKIIFKDVIKFNKRHCVSTGHPPVRRQARPPPDFRGERCTQTPPASSQAPPSPCSGAARPGAASLRGHRALTANRTASVPSGHLCGPGRSGAFRLLGTGSRPLAAGLPLLARPTSHRADGFQQRRQWDFLLMPSVFLTVGSRHLHSQTDLDLRLSRCQTGLEFALSACFPGPFPFLALWSFTWD